ncbi:replication-associated recombination protein A [Kallipyga gabonensis]|uniref:replication-associated recombination protein A n=1 Tax=Kallipyga gabonensis TaxID=1686287 RepID=UPI0006B50ADB|nr:replication-associated recombination protein A [Kallipyga gabonensis]
MDLFDLQREKEIQKTAPLADRLRPKTLDDFMGHEDILGKGKALRRLIEADRVPSLILFGPPGTGKTTLAYVIAQTTRRSFKKISAVTAGVKEVRQVIREAQDAISFDNIRTILFIDEIHRFNKAQQDALLPHVEDGTITLIGATTENPFFEVNKALLSRCQLVELHRLDREDLGKILDRALSDPESGLGKEEISLTDGGREALISASSGDSRILLNSLEIAFLSSPIEEGKLILDKDDILQSIQRKVLSYDKGEEEHYNTISAFIKSVRGSDPDAAIYYLARMLAGGEDPLFIARRLVILASEDIGNAQPMGLVLAQSCMEAVNKIGMPEARIILAQTTIYLACAPKSNAAYLAIDRALDYYRKHADQAIPLHIQDSHYAGAGELNRGLGYLYPHDYPGALVLQNYLPDEIMKGEFYQPTNHGFEGKMKEFLDEKTDILSRRSDSDGDPSNGFHQ